MPFSQVGDLTKWSEAALRYLDEARGLVADGIDDAIPTVDAALACLRIEAGDIPEDPDLLVFDD